MFAKSTHKLAFLTAILALAIFDRPARAQTPSGPTAHGPYTVSVFAPPPAGLTNPDSITEAPNGQNMFPSIVEARVVGHQVYVTPVLEGNAPLIDIATGATVISQQSDPDSLKVDASGDLVLDSQADGDLIFLNAPGSPNQAGLRLHLSNGTARRHSDAVGFGHARARRRL